MWSVLLRCNTILLSKICLAQRDSVEEWDCYILFCSWQSFLPPTGVCRRLYLPILSRKTRLRSICDKLYRFCLQKTFRNQKYVGSKFRFPKLSGQACLLPSYDESIYCREINITDRFMIGITRDVSPSRYIFGQLLGITRDAECWNVVVCRADMTARESRKSPSVNSGFS